MLWELRNGYSLLVWKVVRELWPENEWAVGLSKGFGGGGENLSNVYTLRRKEAGRKEDIKVIKRWEQLKKARL